MDHFHATSFLFLNWEFNRGEGAIVYQAIVFLCIELWKAEKVKLNHWLGIVWGEKSKHFRKQLKSKDWKTINQKKAWGWLGRYSCHRDIVFFVVFNKMFLSDSKWDKKIGLWNFSNFLFLFKIWSLKGLQRKVLKTGR